MTSLSLGEVDNEGTHYHSSRTRWNGCTERIIIYTAKMKRDILGHKRARGEREREREREGRREEKEREREGERERGGSVGSGLGCYGSSW